MAGRANHTPPQIVNVQRRKINKLERYGRTRSLLCEELKAHHRGDASVNGTTTSPSPRPSIFFSLPFFYGVDACDPKS